MAVEAKPASKALATGVALGALVEIPTLLVAIASSGAGHGDYVAARALFPASMLLSLLEHDRIGTFSMVVGLIQFPIYGALLGWSLARRNYLPAALAAMAHVVAAILCFSGLVPNFS